MHLRRYAKALLAFVLICQVILFAPGLQAADEPAAKSDASSATAETKATPAPERSARYGSFGIGIGTGGLGIDYAYPILGRWIDVRAGLDFGSLSYNYDGADDDEEGGGDGEISGDAKLKFSAARFLVDLKPFAGGFRISAGLYTGAPKITLKADGLETYDIGDSSYTADIDARGSVDLGGTAPYLGIGWGGTAGTTGFGASFDLGVLFTGAPGVKLRVPSGRACETTEVDEEGDAEECDVSPANPDGFDVAGDDPRAVQFQDEVETERLEIKDDTKDFDMWPIIRLGLHYRF